MRIAITGTRGIPNRYGGFEQFAQHLSVRLARRGHEVWVYNPLVHPFPGDNFQNVSIIRKPSLEKYIGAASNYLYDFICLKDAVKRKADVVLECGYATAMPALRYLQFKYTKLLINPDGMEWQRQKYNPFIRWIIRMAERNMIKSGCSLVCDSPELVRYYKETYNVDCGYIPYGAEIFSNPDEKVLKEYNVEPFEYFLVIARFEPENNLRYIIRGFMTSHNSDKLLSDSKSQLHKNPSFESRPQQNINSPSGKKLLVAGSPLNNFGRKLIREFSGASDILFTKDIFDQNILDNLRYHSGAYFHGHSAGGTNPSLLEAMAAGSFIIAHDNIFNRQILKDNALYFSNETDIARILLSENEWITKKEQFVKANLDSIEKEYRWEDVTDKYENLFKLII